MQEQLNVHLAAFDLAEEVAMNFTRDAVCRPLRREAERLANAFEAEAELAELEEDAEAWDELRELTDNVARACQQGSNGDRLNAAQELMEALEV